MITFHPSWGDGAALVAIGLCMWCNIIVPFSVSKDFFFCNLKQILPWWHNDIYAKLLYGCWQKGQGHGSGSPWKIGKLLWAYCVWCCTIFTYCPTQGKNWALQWHRLVLPPCHYNAQLLHRNKYIGKLMHCQMGIGQGVLFNFGSCAHHARDSLCSSKTPQDTLFVFFFGSLGRPPSEECAITVDHP